MVMLSSTATSDWFTKNVSLVPYRCYHSASGGMSGSWSPTYGPNYSSESRLPNILIRIPSSECLLPNAFTGIPYPESFPRILPSGCVCPNLFFRDACHNMGSTLLAKYMFDRRSSSTEELSNIVGIPFVFSESLTVFRFSECFRNNYSRKKKTNLRFLLVTSFQLNNKQNSSNLKVRGQLCSSIPPCLLNNKGWTPATNAYECLMRETAHYLISNSLTSPLAFTCQGGCPSTGVA